MSTKEKPYSLTYLPSPLEAVVGVWKFERSAEHTAHARSLPGHLLHLVTRGSYLLRTNGREYRITDGDIIYYHETEDVEWTGSGGKVAFYSVGFLAPTLKPPPIDQRVSRASTGTKDLFAELYREWNSGFQNRFRIHALLNLILDKISEGRASKPSGTQDTPWWKAENGIREKRMFRPAVAELCRLGGTSRGVLFRSCRKSTGKTPIQRIRDIRMEEARGLLSYSHMNISQIADYLGYPRIHEFTRDFSSYFGRPPRTFLHNS